MFIVYWGVDVVCRDDPTDSLAIEGYNTILTKGTSSVHYTTVQYTTVQAIAQNNITPTETRVNDG